MRICSLLPGATEVIAALGLADKLVGVSHECDYPPEVRDKPILVHPRVHSTGMSCGEIDQRVRAALDLAESLYELDEPLLLEMEPTVVITQELCGVCAVTPAHLRQVLARLPRSPSVVTLNPSSLTDVLSDVGRIGEAVHREREARACVEDLQARLRTVQQRVGWARMRPRVVCLEWLDPFYVAGHWVPEMVALGGGLDPLGVPRHPSRIISWEELVQAAPEVLVLMPCGFSRTRVVMESRRLFDHSPWPWQDLPAVRSQRVFAVEATSYFSRPGPRLIEGVQILTALCHPTLFGNLMPAGATRLEVPHGESR